MLESTRRRLMQDAISEAALAISEDDRLSPKVGAILADAAGHVILRAHRGEKGSGDHAEHILLQKAAEQGIGLQDKILFVTLEPCSRRSPKKIPCAVRIARSGIRTVYVGTLDPNPHIIGKGVAHLVTQGLSVEHFPSDLQAELRELNKGFEGSHAYLVDPVLAKYEDEDTSARQRAGILTSTLDLIAGAVGSVSIFTGDSSWLGSLFVGVLEAAINGAQVRLLGQKPLPEDTITAINRLGASFCPAVYDYGIRATLVARDGRPESLIVVENEPNRHASIFGAPFEGTVLSLFHDRFEEAWAKGLAINSASPAKKPKLLPIADEAILEALRKGVPEYASCQLSIQDIDLGKVKFLTDSIEIFKLRRVASTSRLRERGEMSDACWIEGTPWAFFYPIVERQANGDLVVIDGTHRCYHDLQRGIASRRVALVEGVESQLPATPINNSAAKLVTQKWSRRDRYLNYQAAHFRPIRDALAALVTKLEAK